MRSYSSYCLYRGEILFCGKEVIKVARDSPVKLVADKTVFIIRRIYMNDVKTYFLSATSGKTDKGDYYKVSLHFSEDANGKTNEFSVDFFVDVDMYTKCKTFQRFQEVDGVFMPNKKGFAKLVSIEGL